LPVRVSLGITVAKKIADSRAFADLGLSESETRAIYRDNAVKFYRLDRDRS